MSAISLLHQIFISLYIHVMYTKRTHCEIACTYYAFIGSVYALLGTFVQCNTSNSLAITSVFTFSYYIIYYIILLTIYFENVKM